MVSMVQSLLMGKQAQAKPSQCRVGAYYLKLTYHIFSVVLYKGMTLKMVNNAIVIVNIHLII